MDARWERLLGRPSAGARAWRVTAPPSRRERHNAVGALELILILAVVLLIFGASRIPRLARSVGKAPEEFKTGLVDPPEHLDGPGGPSTP